MSSFTAIKCDGCGAGYEWRNPLGGTPSANADRRHLKDTRGWHTVRKTGQATRDICPDCWELKIR